MATAPKTPKAPDIVQDGITSVVPIQVKEDHTPRVRVILPAPPEAESGLKVDPYEHVIINGEPAVYVMRGVPVDVTVPVYMQLRNRYPNI